MNRRRFLAAIGATATAALAGCSTREPTTTTTTTSTSTTTSTATTEAGGVEMLETNTVTLWGEWGRFQIDRLRVGDELGGVQAAEDHNWVLVPVYLDLEQPDPPKVQMHPLRRWRLRGYFGDETTRPLGIVADSRPQYTMGDGRVRRYPVDGTPEAVNEPETVTFPMFGIAFEAPVNDGYELQLLGEDGKPAISVVGRPTEGSA